MDDYTVLPKASHPDFLANTSPRFKIRARQVTFIITDLDA